MGVLMVQVKLPDVDEYGTGCGCMIPYAVMASKEIAGLRRTAVIWAPRKNLLTSPKRPG